MGKWERRQWAVFHNRETGAWSVTDLYQKRLLAMRQRILAWAEMVKWWRADHPSRMVMVTLTYRRRGDYQAGHIRAYLKAIKQSCGSRLWGWAWVSEVQKRGAVHYHLMLLLQKGTRFPWPDKSGMWPWGMSRVETARSPYYLVTYVGKAYQKDLSKLPKGCRLYGVSIRFGDEVTQNVYRSMAGLQGSGRGVSDWHYSGAAVTEGYARHVLAQAPLE